MSHSMRFVGSRKTINAIVSEWLTLSYICSKDLCLLSTFDIFVLIYKGWHRLFWSQGKSNPCKNPMYVLPSLQWNF